MTLRTDIRLGLTVFLAAAAAACGQASSAKMSVHLVDAPGDYLEVNVHVVKVEIQSGGSGWVTLGTPDRTVNLLGLTGGVAATLVDGATIPPGRYGQMRLVLGSGNSVKLLDGTLHDLTAPSGLQSGVKLIVHFDVQAGTTRDVYIDFDAHRSIWLHGAGASGQYILRPVIRAVDKLATGAIAGKLSGAQGEGSAPLAGALVTAQALDGTGTASIVRSVQTGLDGSYVLDLLPAGGSYHVVSQPGVAGTVFLAMASAPIAITEAAPVGRYDATFSQAGGSGTVTGTVTDTGTALDADLVEARQSLDAGGTPHDFIVRTAVPTVSGPVESYTMELLPIGGYALSAERRHVDALGNETVASSGTVAATVTSGGTATANLAFP